jgi:hypothetical protein
MERCSDEALKKQACRSALHLAKPGRLAPCYLDLRGSRGFLVAVLLFVAGGASADGGLAVPSF